MAAIDTTNGISGQQTTLGTSADGTAFTTLANIMEVPDVGGKLDKIESTTLSSTSKTYVAGLMDPGDLAFKFRYDTSTFQAAKALEGKTSWFEVTYPDGTAHKFQGQATVSMDSIKTGSLVTFTLNVVPLSAITVVNPT